MDLNAEIAKYFFDRYSFSNEKEMAGVLRSGRLEARIKEMVTGEIVSARRGGKFIYLTTADARELKLFINKECVPIVG